MSTMRVALSLVLIGVIGTSSNSSFATRVPAPATNDRHAAIAELGRKMFFDANLSRDGSISCSSCHQPTHAFSDGLRVSLGVGKQAGTRNTPSLLNATVQGPLFWDGRRDQLQVAVLDPVTNPVEMAQPDIDSVARAISGRTDYRAVIARAYPDSRELSREQMGEAIATFLHGLPSPSSPYDRYAAGRRDALDDASLDGLRLFEGKAGCADCHQLAAGQFSDGKYHHSGVGIDAVAPHLGELTTRVIHDNLQGPAVGAAVAEHADLSALGRFMISHRIADVGAFRTPSLRNVAATAPYMHDGSVKTLEQAVDTEIYYRGLSTGKPIALTVQERADLLAFLRSLGSGSHP